ncbi:hypothetical protein M569_13296, partial [Genlisea aurea]
NLLQEACQNMSKGFLHTMTAPVDPPSPCKKTELVSYFPAPLATKIYYSQRTHRLRTALRRMFFETS